MDTFSTFVERQVSDSWRCVEKRWCCSIGHVKRAAPELPFPDVLRCQKNPACTLCAVERTPELRPSLEHQRDFTPASLRESCAAVKGRERAAASEVVWVSEACVNLPLAVAGWALHGEGSGEAPGPPCARRMSPSSCAGPRAAPAQQARRKPFFPPGCSSCIVSARW